MVPGKVSSWIVRHEDEGSTAGPAGGDLDDILLQKNESVDDLFCLVFVNRDLFLHT